MCLYPKKIHFVAVITLGSVLVTLLIAHKKAWNVNATTTVSGIIHPAFKTYLLQPYLLEASVQEEKSPWNLP
jgi:hypothetical protein